MRSPGQTRRLICTNFTSTGFTCNFYWSSEISVQIEPEEKNAHSLLRHTGESRYPVPRVAGLKRLDSHVRGNDVLEHTPTKLALMTRRLGY
jgi:hypothetical protein